MMVRLAGSTERQCWDCHKKGINLRMPSFRPGRERSKFTDHHVQSPLLNIANSCAVCHRCSEEEIRTRVEAIQEKVARAMLDAERALVRAHFDIAAAIQAQQMRLMTARLFAKKGSTDEPRYPDLSTREKAWQVAQAFVNGEHIELLQK